MGSTSSREVSVDEVRQSVKEIEITDDAVFYDRKEELQKLAHVLGGKPKKITLLLGPKSSGKSTLLSRLKDLWDHNPGRQTMAPLVIINMRMEDCSTPALLAATLKEEFKSWKDRCLSVLGALGSTTVMGYPASELVTAVRGFWDNGLAGTSSLRSIQAAMYTYCSRYKLLSPVIIIDEANMLNDWERAGYSLELKNFVSFLEGLTKEKQMAHVVLASSDDFFWLTKKILPGQLRVMGLGYFSETDAEGFFLSRYDSSGIERPGNWQTDVWPRIYAVAGGSPLHLNTLVDEIGQETLLPEVENLLDTEKIALSNVLGSSWDPDDAGDVCSASDYRAVMRAIVENAGAASLQSIYAKYNSDEVTKAKVNSIIRYLVRINAVHVRVVTATSGYKDIPPRSPSGEYIMAVSPGALAGMRALLD